MTLENQPIEKNENLSTLKKSPVDQHDLIMILLLMIISLRSVVWNIFQLVNESNFSWLIAIGISAFIGKIAGGWLADKIGWRLYAMLSILIATPLLTICRKEWFLFCIGIGLLQSGIPATTSLLIQSLKGKTARGISLSFGAAIIIGALASFFPLQLLLGQIPVILTLSGAGKWQ
jgi:predicted MFS family arabinose efflux permease